MSRGIPEPMTQEAHVGDPDYPRTIDEVTADWLTRFLAEDGCLPAGSRVTAADAEPLSAGFGQTGDTFRLTLELRGDQGRAPSRLVVKLATTDPARRRASAHVSPYAREVDFYRVVAPQLTTRVPHCYRAECGDEGQTFVLLLEDLDGYRPGDETIGCSPAEALLAVDQLARLHAPFWGHPADAGVAPQPPMPMDILRPAWDVMVRDFGALLPPAVLAMRDGFLDDVPRMHDWILGEPATIADGDFRLDNLMFAADPVTPSSEAVAVLDWQAVHGGKGIRDLAYLVTQSMNTADRRSCEDELIQTYAARLADLGVMYEPAQARHDYRAAVRYLFIIVVYITGVNVNAHPRAAVRKCALVERVCSALADWGHLDDGPVDDGPTTEGDTC